MEFLPVLELIDRLCIARVKHVRTQGANQVELEWMDPDWDAEAELQKIFDEFDIGRNNQ